MCSYCKAEKLIFDCCCYVHFGSNWLLKFASHLPQLASLELVIRFVITLPESMTGLTIFGEDSVESHRRLPLNKNLYTLKFVIQSRRVEPISALA